MVSKTDVLTSVKYRPSGRLLIAVMIALAAVIVVAWFISEKHMALGQKNRPGNTTSVAPNKPGDKTPQVILAAPGRVEGVSEMVNVGAGSDGVLSAVFVEEGQQVKSGQLIATIACHDIETEIRAARANADSIKQARNRLLRGSRNEERQEALAETARTQAILKQAQTQYQRMRHLVESGDISKEMFENARRDLEVAQAGVRVASERQSLINAPPLPEELARAEAEILAAEENVKTKKAKLDKCTIKSPISGTVMRRHMEAGETVSSVFPQPIISIMDTSHLRVRAEVDERDIGRVNLGQQALILTDSLAGKTIQGHVVSTSSLMGRKKIRTGDPAEKSDRDVLEVIVSLEEQDKPLVVGLRVTVQFLSTGS